MKLCEIVELPEREQLDEINLKQAIAGGAMALGSLMSQPVHHELPPVEPSHLADMNAAKQAQLMNKKVDTLANNILKKYRVSPDLAKKVASLAQKHEKASFPKAEDILAIVGIESSFKPNSVSGLKKDPAVGLTQVRPGVWGLNPQQLLGDVEMQIKTGSDILHKYYQRLGNAEDAVHAYNVGIGNFKRGNHNLKYVDKYKNEVRLYRT